MEGRFDFGTFRRRDVLTMGRFDCKAFWDITISTVYVTARYISRGMGVRKG